MPEAFGLYFHEYGKEETSALPLVLLHGAGGTHLYWPQEIRRLKGYHVLAPDLPGHGKSADMRGLQRIPEYAAWVRDWLADMSIRRAVIAGHSMGGAIALTMALLDPALVAGLALVATGPRLPVNQRLLDEAGSPTSFLKAVDQIIAWSFGSQAAPRLVELAHKRMLESRQSVLLGDLQACNEFDVVNDLETINCPTQVVCGKEDRMAPSRFSQLLSSSIAHAQLELIPDAGHMVMLEQPHAVAAALTTFMGQFVQKREVI